KVVRVFALDRPVAPLELRGHDAPIRSAVWSPDGQHIVTAASDPTNASIDHTAKVWSAELHVSTQRGAGLFHSAFIGQNCNLVVSASDDNIARLWSLDGKSQRVDFKGHEGWIANAALSPDCKSVVTVSFDKTARVWKVDKTQMVELKGHEAAVRFASFSPD